MSSYSDYLQTVRAQEERNRAKFTGEQEPNVECHQWSRDDFERISGKLKDAFVKIGDGPWFKAQNVHIEMAADALRDDEIDAFDRWASLEI